MADQTRKRKPTQRISAVKRTSPSSHPETAAQPQPAAQPETAAQPGTAAPPGTAPQSVFRPSGIRAPHGSTIFEVSWPDGTVHRVPHRVLRGFCPCAGCQGHSGSIEFQAGNNLQLREIKPVGNYALGLVWGDLHSSGIYSFEYLHQLGSLVNQLGEEGLIQQGTLPRGRIVAAGNEGG